MYLRTLTIYCFVDDLLKALQHRQDPRAAMSDAEVLTVALCAMLFFGGNYAKSRDYFYSFGMMPRMLHKAQFSRRLHRLGDVAQLLFHQLGATLKELNQESRYCLDSFPLPMCDNIRIPRCRLTAQSVDPEQFRGYCASKRRYFYGLKVQVISTIGGVPVEYVVTPGAQADIEGLTQLAWDLPAGAQVAADAAYTHYEWEDFLAEMSGGKLLVGRKGNSRRWDDPYLHYYKKWIRRHIETAFSEVSKMFPKTIHATNFSGFLLKIGLFLLASQMDKGFIQ